MPTRPLSSVPTRPIPGAYLLHPAIVVSLVLWICNDHIFKGQWPGLVTGKVSDVVSLIVFPLLLVTAIEKTCNWLSSMPLSARGHNYLLIFAALATGSVMASINLAEGAATLYEWGLGYAQWPVRGALALGRGSSLPVVEPVQLWMDPSDCWTLPVLAIPLFLGWRRTETPFSNKSM